MAQFNLRVARHAFNEAARADELAANYGGDARERYVGRLLFAAANLADAAEWREVARRERRRAGR